MFSLLQKLPFIFELFFNGSFILLFSLSKSKKLPASWDSNIVLQALEVSSWIVPIIILFTIFVNYMNEGQVDEFIRKHVFSLIIGVPMIITWGDVEFCFWLASVHLLASVFSLYENENTSTEKGKRKKDFSQSILIERLKLKPAQIVLITFLGIIGIGSLLLMIPLVTVDGKAIDPIDAIFMATSATCVTGLSTLSITENFNLGGQLIILALIQIGGLGIMTLSTSLTIFLGKSLAMKERIIMQEMLDVSNLEELIELIFSIIKYAFVIELWGGIILTLAFTFEGFEFSKALYYGFFHSISAFCNAGFSLFNNSLESFSTNPLVHTTISVLIILGGLGFIVLKELRHAIVERKSFVRFSLHSKIVLISSAALILLGGIAFFFGEFLNSLDGYTLWEKLQISFFQSVTLRTAGFNTIPMNNLNTYTIYLMCLFMFIGAAPGSTGGGIKVSTFAILVTSIKTTLKGKDRVEMFDRRIPPSMVVRATAVTIISLMISSLFIFILTKFESEQNFLVIFFEVLSATGTVGLTLGVTPYLSVMGKIAISLLMFIGRVGPLTLVLAIGQSREQEGGFEYPEGRVMIG